MSSSTDAGLGVDAVHLGGVSVGDALALLDRVRGVTRPGRVVRGAAAATAATEAFVSVTDLDAPVTEDELVDRLSEADRELLDEMAERGYQKGFAAGEAEGRAAGYEAGRAAALTQLAARSSQALDALDAAVAELDARDAVTLAELDEQVSAFALEVAEAVLARTLDRSDDPGLDALDRALAFAPDRGPVTARLHPADVEMLGAVDVLAPGRPVQVVADASVQPGGCILEVGSCRVDTQFGPALDRVRRVLGLPVSGAAGERAAARTRDLGRRRGDQSDQAEAGS